MTATPSRGDVWEVRTVTGTNRTGIVVSVDAVNQAYGRALIVPLRPPAEVPGTLVAITISAPLKGIAVPVDLTPMRLATFTTHVGRLPQEDLELLEQALRATMDL